MRSLLFAGLVLWGCGAAPPAPDLAADRARPGVAWSPWSAETFARAKAEGRYVLVDGVAAWCHWCHVMDATTYRDPAVVALLAERFVAIQVDVDARPDIHDRYAAWGWPATILLSPDGQEIGKYKGYLEPAELLAILRAVKPAAQGPARPGADVP
ncbi:MAG: DUF255 domain-containing protein, partial [Myxococcales bacterium]|nr:DUF255 domain-containing protein [Myxococcales bacterium]